MISTAQRYQHSELDVSIANRKGYIPYPNNKDDSLSQQLPYLSNCPTIIKSQITKCPNKIKIIKKNNYVNSIIKTQETKTIKKYFQSQQSNNLTITPKRLFLFDEENEDIRNHQKQQSQMDYQEISTSLSNSSFEWLTKKDNDIEILEPVDEFQFSQHQKPKKLNLNHHKSVKYPQTFLLESIFLTGSSGAIQNTKFEFNCFRDSDLKIPKEHMNKYQQLVVDDDVMTDDETLDNFVQVCYKDILSGIKYQATKRKNKRADMKDPLWKYFKPRLLSSKSAKLIKI